MNVDINNKPTLDWFKTVVGIAIILGGFFMNRLVTELDEARHDVRQLEIQLSSMQTSLKFIEAKLNGK